MSPDHLQAYLDTALCPARSPRDPNSSDTGEDGNIVWWEGGTRRRISMGTSDAVGARQSLADFEAKLEHHPLKLALAEALDRYTLSRQAKVTAVNRMKHAVTVLKAGLGDLRVDQISQTQWDRYVEARVTRPPRLALTMNIGPLVLTNSGPPPVSLTC